MKHEGSKLDLGGTGYCASLNFRRTARAVTQLYDAALEETGVRSTQFAILVGIAKKQPVSIGALAEVLTIDRTTLTRSLQLLKKEDLITISARAHMRQRYLALTPKGERTLGHSLPVWRRVHERFVATVGRDYWVDLRNELERLAHVAVELEKPPKDTHAEAPANA
jgi:DNA-binding MarR family transcriptional regulator